MGRENRLFTVVLLATFVVSCSSVPEEIRMESVDQIADAIARARPGDTLVLPNGLYKDLHIAFEAAGEEGKPITLRGETPTKVVITGKAHIRITGRHLVVHDLVFDQAWGGNIVAFSKAEHCRLTDCAFIECGNPKSTFGHIITLQQRSRHNRLDHCYMQGNLSMGMGVRVAEDDCESTDNTFDHNYYKDIDRRYTNGQEVVQIGQGSFSTRQDMRALVEYCLFDHTNGDCEIISNKSSHNTYRWNTFRNCDAAELVLRGGHYATVEGNFFLNGLGGVRVHGDHHRIIGNCMEDVKRGLYIPHGSTNYSPVHHSEIAGNLIVNTRSYGIHLGETKTDADKTHPNYQPPHDNRFVGNVIVSDAGVLVRQDSGQDNTWQDNIVWPTGKAAQGLEADGLQKTDPKLTKTDGLYRLPLAEGAQADLRPLEPGDVGPGWMGGDPTRIRRIDSPQPIPKIERKEKG